MRPHTESTENAATGPSMSAAAFSPAPCAYPFVHARNDAGGSRAKDMNDSLGAAGAIPYAANDAAVAGMQQRYCSVSQPLAMSYAPPYNGGTDGTAQSAATAAGGGYLSSWHSLEVPGATQPPIPQSDFYTTAAQANESYYPYQPRYAESLMTSADLYSAGIGSASAMMGYGPAVPMTGVSGYGFMDQAAGSVLSSASCSGSRCAQWYLPRGYCPMPCFNVAGGSFGSSYGLYADCTSTGITPTTISMGPNSMEEETLSSLDGRPRYVVVPPPPRLAPQSSSDPVAPFVLPPSFAAAAAGSDVHMIGILSASPSGMMESPSSASLPNTSPASRVARTPHFLPYDGRAYGIPAHKIQISSTEAATAVVQCPLVALAQRGGYNPVETAQPALASVEKTGMLHTMHAYPHVASSLTPHAPLQSHGISTGDMCTVSEPVAGLCSPEESALLADVHARLVQQHRASQLLKERSSAQRASVEPLSRADLVDPAKIPALEKNVGANGSCDDVASFSITTIEEAAVAALSPIPRPPAANDTDAETSAQSLWEGAEAAAQPPTRDALDRVLTVPGVVWRHDPYSRQVLPQTQATAESDGSEATSASCSSLSSGPCVTRAAVGLSDRGDATASITQPPRSADVSAGTNGSSSSAADGVRPSSRRLPTKKVCVRHYVQGDGDLSLSHENSGVVGALLSVREVPTATVPVALCASGTCAPHCHSAAMGNGDAGAIPASPMEAAPAVMLTPTALEGAESAKQSVPKPRSKQAGHPALTRGAKASAANEHAAESSAHSSIVSSASGQLQSSHLKASSELSSVAPPEAAEAAPGMVATSADPAATATMWPVGRRPSSRSYSPGLSAACPAYQPSSRWAWGLRSARVHPLTAPAEMDAREVEPPVATLTDLDTSFLARLWQKLELSGCFRDALERRRRVIGPGSNSSARVLRRMIPLARRLMYRRHGLEAENGSGPRFTVLDESDMKYVCLLQHGFRKSTAVAATHYVTGTMVVLDGDMGIDTGVVELCLTREEYESMTDMQRRAAHLVVHLEFPLASSIHRAARADEILMHGNTQLPLEEATLEFLRYLTTQPHLFQSCRVEWMHFVDAEFQADGQKLYVHYTCDSPVRFLELATFLNHIFHCRVWMKVIKADEL
ncbi:hypothetical protein LSCM4_03565 [Leishmania orientalis]|uniref:PSP1 C-terminal domain-containing protein n=1 Tax=Leishmania orientalis TaxID=2249476 RepID=A0A836KGR5_9TRYP|nr:hypothetical protein LSCM4_03565 [Leishmania orientalis]